jgi:lipoyl(octanoyl) transferase
MNSPQPLEYSLSTGLTDYLPALAAMERRAQDIASGQAPEMLWFLEHPPLYTAGTSARAGDLLDRRFPVYDTGRGGEWTYHGPGQRVGYVMLNLKARGAMDVRRYVQSLEQWLIATLARFGVEGFTREGRIGVWVNEGGGESKIAALGIRIKKWVTYHGIALNVTPDLSHYSGIVPCGIQGYGVTSLNALGIKASMEDVDAALKQEFEKIFQK